jgi:hypothetical protein
MVIVACGITAPLESVTVPVKVPDSSCPHVRGQDTSRIAINRRRKEWPLIELVLFTEIFGTYATSVQDFELSDLIGQVVEPVISMSLS